MEGEGRMGRKGREEGRERETAGMRGKIENPLAPGSSITKYSGRGDVQEKAYQSRPGHQVLLAPFSPYLVQGPPGPPTPNSPVWGAGLLFRI